MADQVADLPHKMVILDSYLWIPTLRAQCGRPGGRSTPRNGDFRFLLIDSYSESSDVADQVADLPPLERQFYSMRADI